MVIRKEEEGGSTGRLGLTHTHCYMLTFFEDIIHRHLKNFIWV